MQTIGDSSIPQETQRVRWLVGEIEVTNGLRLEVASAIVRGRGLATE